MLQAGHSSVMRFLFLSTFFPMKKSIVAGAAFLSLLSALPVMAKNDNGLHLGARADANIELFGKTNADPACMQAAVRQRGTAFVDAFNAYNQSIVSALKIKTDAEVSAWAKVSVSERAIAIAAAEKTFTSSYNTASKKLLQAKNDARQVYSKAALSCMKKWSSSRSSTSSVSSGQSSTTSSASSASTVACSDLSGKLTGAFTLTSPINDEGRKLSLTGTGSVNGGSVQMNGVINGLGFVAVGRAAGDITITQSTQGTLVLHLEGPVQSGFSTLPKSFRYTVKSATGVFANVDTTGEAELQLKGDLNGSFRLEFKGKCDR